MFSTLLLSSLALATEPDVVCPEHARHELILEAGIVELAFFRSDVDAFDAARRAMGQLMLCIDEPLMADDVAQLHRARAIIAYVEEDLEASKRAFAALHALKPEWTLPQDQLSFEHPLWKVAEEAMAVEEREIGLAVSPTHGWAVDGTRYPTADDPLDEEGHPTGEYFLPADRAFVLQVFGDHEEVIYTGYHMSTVDIPIQDLVVMPDPREAHRKRRVLARAIGSSIGGALLAGAAVTLGIGVDIRAPLLKNQVPLANIDATQARANLFGQTSAGLAGGGALVISLAWAVPW